MAIQVAVAGKPDLTEYLPYYGRHISQVSADDIVSYLDQQGRELSAKLATITESQSDFR